MQTLMLCNGLDGACLEDTILACNEFLYRQCSAELGLIQGRLFQIALLVAIRSVRNPRRFVADTDPVMLWCRVMRAC